MADAPAVHIGENSPENIALVLFKMIAAQEGKHIIPIPTARANTDKKWILSTYAECIATVRSGSYIEKTIE